ncbi:MAG TPA: glycosyltransferase, partial [bacterium]
GIENKLSDFLNVFPNLREIFIYPIMGKKIIRELDQHYDIAHYVSPHTLAWDKPKIPTLISVHYLISRQALMLGQYLPCQYKLFFNFLSYQIFLHYETRGLQNATCITVSRQAYKEYLTKRMKLPPEKIRIVKYGIEHNFFMPAKNYKAKENIALFVGRGSLPKGFNTLAKSAAQIKGKIIAVASQIPENLQQQIKRLDNFHVVTGVS